MQIKMLKTAQGSDNGLVVNDYAEGEVYEVGEALARVFLDARFAEEVVGEAAQGEQADAGEAPDGQDLAAMTVAQLKALAEAEGIDLGAATKKAEIIALIEAAVAADAPADNATETEEQPNA